MRFNGIKLAGLAVALVGVSAKDAVADDVTITTDTTTPLATSSPDGVSPGDVTIDANGSITIAAGETAVTVDSDNDVTNAGNILSEDANDTTGILLLDGFAGSITNSGAIRLTEDYDRADADNDGDLDGDFAQGSNRTGIWLQSGTFTGDIVSSGGIEIEGQDSAGVRLDGLLDGDLTISGGLSVTGENAVAVAIDGGATGGVTGDVLVRGGATIIGTNAQGLLVGAPIGGELRINGAWNSTGYSTVNRPADTSDLDADDLQQSGSPIAVHFSVDGGITIEGVGVEDDEDDDGDGVTEADGDTDDDLTTSINAYGSAPALLIQADPSADLVLGATASGYGLHVRGTIAAQGVYDGVEATAIEIAGDGGAQVTTAGGIAIDNVTGAAAIEADATAVHIGAGAVVPEILIRRAVTGAVTAETAQTAYGVRIEAGADVAALNVTGSLRAQLFGETGDAVTILDQSNTLATITNSGTLAALIVATDDDPTDDVPPPAIVGEAVAIDVSASTIDVTYSQVPDTPFTDDDANDDDAAGRLTPSLLGDIRFGSGADTLNLLAGTITGDVAFGAGADSMVIDNGASYFGQISDSDGLLSINVIDGTLSLNGGTTNLTTANFGASAQLGVLLSDTPADATFINATGAVNFDAGASIVLTVPDGLPSIGSQTFLTAAGGLTGASNVTGPVTAAGTPYLYNLAIGVVAGDPNSLEATYVQKTASELGLNANQAIALNPIIAALRLDDDAAAAFASLDTEFEFFDAYEDMVPTFSSAMTELAATAIQQQQSAATNRLSATRLNDLDEVSVWAQEIAYGLTREPPSVSGQDFRGHGFGLAVGIDGPLDNGALFGVSASFITSEMEEPGRPEGQISGTFGQLNAYLGTAMGPIDLDVVAGAGLGQLQSRRVVEIGPSFSTESEAEWWSYEGHGAIRASLPLAVGDWLVISPQTALSYVYMSEEGYTESGGGALDLEADTVNSQRLWGDVGLEVSARWQLRGGGIIAPRIYGGYRANLIDDEAERTFRFASGGSDFTLTDEGYGDGAPLVGVGIDATNGYSTFSLGYEGEFGDQIDRHSLNAAIRFRF